MKNKGFTFIELLVVIAILAAILFPVFAQAKTAAKKAGEPPKIDWYDPMSDAK